MSSLGVNGLGGDDGGGGDRHYCYNTMRERLTKIDDEDPRERYLLGWMRVILEHLSWKNWKFEGVHGGFPVLLGDQRVQMTCSKLIDDR